ncbi:MAG: hypothetical protein Q9211_004005 [Gyalolechia sp. 1 TL-2023]
MGLPDVKLDLLDGSDDGSEQKSRFDNVSEEDTFDIFDRLLESNSEDGDEADSPSIALTTSRQRDRALKAWHHPSNIPFIIMRVVPNANPEQVWVDLCKNDAAAFRIVKACLKFYVGSSKEKRPTLDPEEYVMEKAVKSARSLNAFWKALIAAADVEVLAPVRKKSPDNYQLVLKRPKNYPGSADEGPVSRISHWIYHGGAEETGLSTVAEYTKVEMTARDVGVILRTPWLLADWIPITPKETQKRIAGTKRKRSRCHEVELNLDFDEPTATELDQKRARVPAAYEAQDASFDEHYGLDMLLHDDLLSGSLAAKGGDWMDMLNDDLQPGKDCQWLDEALTDPLWVPT